MKTYGKFLVSEAIALVQVDRGRLQGALAVARVAVGGQEAGGSVQLLIKAVGAPVDCARHRNKGGNDGYGLHDCGNVGIIKYVLV